MGFSKEYNIVFSSLSLGIHEFDYHLTDSFFEDLEYSEIEKADVKVLLKFEKKENMLLLDFKVNGEVTLPCDRCGEDLTLEAEGEFNHIIKFGEEAYEETDDITVISEKDYEFNVGELIYEFVNMSIPHYRAHPEGECNQEALDRLGQDEDSDKDKVDPRWDALSKLKK